MQVDDIKIEILTRGESVRYLGQWATFHKYRQELTSKNYMVKHRLRLFDAAITPTICYASGTWAPTKELDATQNAPSHHTNKKKIHKDRETLS